MNEEGFWNSEKQRMRDEQDSAKKKLSSMLDSKVFYQTEGKMIEGETTKKESFDTRKKQDEQKSILQKMIDDHQKAKQRTEQALNNLKQSQPIYQSPLSQSTSVIQSINPIEPSMEPSMEPPMEPSMEPSMEPGFPDEIEFEDIKMESLYKIQEQGLRVVALLKVENPSNFEPKQFVIAMKDLLYEAESIPEIGEQLKESTQNVSDETKKFVKLVVPQLDTIPVIDFLNASQGLRSSFATLFSQAKSLILE